MSALRVAASVLLVVAAALVAAPAGAAAEAVSVTPDAGYVSRTLNFGDDRDEKTIHFYFTAALPLTAAPNATLRGVATSNGEQFDGTVTSNASLDGGNKTIDVTVTVDPDDPKAGDYTGDLLLRGTGVTDARAALTLKLHALPWPGGREEWPAWVLAFLLIFGGALLGWFTQWLAGPGAKLRDLVNRYEVVNALGGTLTLPPPGYKTALLEAGSHLAHRELDKAEPKIKALEDGTPIVAKISTLATGLNELFTDQRETIEQMATSGAERDRLLRIVAIEENVRDDLLSDGWPDPAPALTAAKEHLPHLRRFSSFLVLYPTHGASKEFKAAVRQYLAGDYAEAEKSWQSVPSDGEIAVARTQSGPAVELRRMDAEGAFEVPERASLARVASFSPSLWAARHAPTITGLLVVIGLCLAGLATVFDPDETFRTDTGSDALELFIWGLAAGLGGVTISQLTGRLPTTTAAT
jgi:hypothetical protein